MRITIKIDQILEFQWKEFKMGLITASHLYLQGDSLICSWVHRLVQREVLAKRHLQPYTHFGYSYIDSIVTLDITISGTTIAHKLINS